MDVVTGLVAFLAPGGEALAALGADDFAVDWVGLDLETALGAGFLGLLTVVFLDAFEAMTIL